jgi:hypothetical protein
VSIPAADWSWVSLVSMSSPYWSWPGDWYGVGTLVGEASWAVVGSWWGGCGGVGRGRVVGVGGDVVEVSWVAVWAWPGGLLLGVGGLCLVGCVCSWCLLLW